MSCEAFDSIIINLVENIRSEMLNLTRDVHTLELNISTINRLEEKTDDLKQRFVDIQRKFDHIENLVDELLNLTRDLHTLELNISTINRLEEKTDDLKQRFVDIQRKFDHIENLVDELQEKISDVKLIESLQTGLSRVHDRLSIVEKDHILLKQRDADRLDASKENKQFKNGILIVVITAVVNFIIWLMTGGK